MGIDISAKNEARLRATAQAEGVSIDAYIEQILNEREELVAVAERAAALMPQLSHNDQRVKIERGFLESEHGEVADGEAFSAGLIAELDKFDRNRRAG
jgi:hypothetical protein